MAFESLLADRTKRMKSSAIREILKVISRPGMVSLAGGVPSPKSFPLERLTELTTLVVDKYAGQILQYDRTEGFAPLLEELAAYFNRQGIAASADQILITSGSQAVLDGMGKAFISRGDYIAIEAPTYLGALQAFNAYEAEFVSVETDEDGLNPDSLEAVLERYPVKFVYLVPTFQNPTGRTLPLERRQRIAELIQRHNVLLIEDDPYSALRYRGDYLPPIYTFAPEHVVLVNTLSKVLAPGLRIGYVLAPAFVKQWLVLAKQGTDLQTSTFNQALAAEYLSGGHLEEHLPSVLDLYRPKQEAMLRAFDEHFPDCFTRSNPEGGMFVWAQGPATLDIERVFAKAIERNVAFVPGRHFYISEDQGRGTMRLNYTLADEDTLDGAVKILAGVVEEELEIARSEPCSPRAGA